MLFPLYIVIVSGGPAPAAVAPVTADPASLARALYPNTDPDPAGVITVRPPVPEAVNPQIILTPKIVSIYVRFPPAVPAFAAVV